jgi:hypothetical protein
VLSIASVLPAATINLGILSFDTTSTQSVNSITIQNLSGSAALLPDFPVLSPLSFNSLSLTVVSGNNSSTINLNNLGSGQYPSDPLLEFSSSFEIESITLSAILNLSQFEVDGVGTQKALSPNLLVVLSPSVGDILQPGIDFVLITTEATTPSGNSEIPEPGTWLMIGSSLLLFRFRR